jgi:hypothetical protein
MNLGLYGKDCNFDVFDNCSTCGEQKAAKKCSVCKKVCFVTMNGTNVYYCNIVLDFFRQGQGHTCRGQRYNKRSRSYMQRSKVR